MKPKISERYKVEILEARRFHLAAARELSRHIGMTTEPETMLGELAAYAYSRTSDLLDNINSTIEFAEKVDQELEEKTNEA